MCWRALSVFVKSVDLGSNDVQIPLWNAALAKSPVSEYPPRWPQEWKVLAGGGQKSPAIPNTPGLFRYASVA